MARVSGTLFVKIDGVQRDAQGSWTYNLGQPKREVVIGADRVHGYMEKPQVAFIEGEITDQSDLDLVALQNLTDSTITLEVANGKIIIVRNAYYAADGNVGGENANIQVRFEGISGEELAP